MPVRVYIDRGRQLVEASASAEDSLSAEDVVTYLEHAAAPLTDGDA
jgi:hypothetical protein